MITIIGAGLTGLSIAYHLQQAGVEYQLLEASGEAGGYMKTICPEGYVLDLGPNSIMVDRELHRFIDSIGLKAELVPANEVSKSRYIYKQGRYRKLPDNPVRVLFSNYFSIRTRLKILKEPFEPPQEIEQETLAEFFSRRFGQEVVNYAVTPFITGIYAGDPKEILIDETFPMLKEYERVYGSLLKGFIRNKPERRQSYNFKKGMQSLPYKLSLLINNIKYHTKLLKIDKEGTGFNLSVQSKEEHLNIKTQVLIITTPAFSIQPALQGHYPDLASALSMISYPPVTVVHSVFNRREVGHPLNGFGGLNPDVENLFSSGCIWTSSVFPGRVPEDKVLFTNFVGGALNAEKARLEDDIILKNVVEELKKNYDISGSPVMQHVFKWDKAIPQYNKDLKKAKALIKDVETDNLFFSANWTNGVSLPDSIKKGKQLADKIIKLEVR